MRVWGDDLQCRKMHPVSARIAGKDSVVLQLCMRPDEKIRQCPISDAAPASIFVMRLSGEERRGIRYILAIESVLWQGRFQFVLLLESCCDLRIYDRIDNQRTVFTRHE